MRNNHRFESSNRDESAFASVIDALISAECGKNALWLAVLYPLVIAALFAINAAVANNIH